MYCIYLRKSRADLELEARGELETLSRHRRALLDHAEKHGLVIGAVYEEIVSGETIQDRPVVSRLLGEVERGDWDGVLVMEVERLARGDTIDQGVVARAFQLGKAKIVTPLKTYDPDNEFDEEYFEFGLFMSRREYKTINRRIQRGRIASAKEGKFLGSEPPYGYDKVSIPGEKGFTLRPNDEEADVVRYIFQRYISGTGIESIAGELDAMGASPRKRAIWSKATINGILKNPVYIGKLRWSYRVEQKYMLDGKIEKRRVVSKNPIYVDGLHQAIVAERVFEKALEVRRLNLNKKTKQSCTLKNLLSGLIYCAECGRLMTRLGSNKHTPYDFLKCPNRYCKNVSSPMDLVEDKLLCAISDLLSELKLSFTAEEANSDGEAALRSASDTLEREIERLRGQLTKTYDLLERGIYTEEVFAARNGELVRKIATAKKQDEEIKGQLEEKEGSKGIKEHLPEAVSALDAYSLALTNEEKNEILHQLLVRVEYRKMQPNRRGNRDNANFELDIYPKIF